eukprot:scaffold572735_cov169-Attheya_sp.AAC.1
MAYSKIWDPCVDMGDGKQRGSQIEAREGTGGRSPLRPSGSFDGQSSMELSPCKVHNVGSMGKT